MTQFVLLIVSEMAQDVAFVEIQSVLTVKIGDQMNILRILIIDIEGVDFVVWTSTFPHTQVR
jgi:hypothetical protein